MPGMPPKPLGSDRVRDQGPSLWMLRSMMIGLGIGFGRAFLFKSFGPNDMFLTAGIILAVTIGLPILTNLIGKQSKMRMFKCVASSMYTGVLTAAMFLAMGGMVVASFYSESKYMRQFAASDFERFEQNGVVSKSALDAELKQQNALRQQLRSLGEAQNSIDSSDGSAPAKWVASTGLRALQEELKARKLDDEQVTRIAVTSQNMHLVSSNDTATRDALAQTRSTLHEKYGLWERILTKLGFI